MNWPCPNCGNDRHVYWGGSWCGSCGWHAKGQTLAHEDFRPDPACPWCNPEPVDSWSEEP